MKIAQLLLEAGADKDLQDHDGYTALMLAAGIGHVKIAQLLLEAGADKDLQDSDVYTALMHAAGHEVFTRFLLEAGAKKDLQRDDGYTALMIAEEFGHGEVATLLRAKARKISHANLMSKH